MADATHTTGPWRVLQWADDKNGFIAIVGPSDPPEHIADVFPFGKRAAGTALDKHNANARLIVAAPDMLATLRELVRQVEISNAVDDHGHALANLRALANARVVLANATRAAP